MGFPFLEEPTVNSQEGLTAAPADALDVERIDYHETTKGKIPCPRKTRPHHGRRVRTAGLEPWGLSVNLRRQSSVVLFPFEVDSPLPEDGIDFQGHGNAVVVRYDARRIVLGGAGRRD